MSNRKNAETGVKMSNRKNAETSEDRKKKEIIKEAVKLAVCLLGNKTPEEILEAQAANFYAVMDENMICRSLKRFYETGDLYKEDKSTEVVSQKTLKERVPYSLVTQGKAGSKERAELSVVLAECLLGNKVSDKILTEQARDFYSVMPRKLLRSSIRRFKGTAILYKKQTEVADQKKDTEAHKAEISKNLPDHLRHAFEKYGEINADGTWSLGAGREMAEFNKQIAKPLSKKELKDFNNIPSGVFLSCLPDIRVVPAEGDVPVPIISSKFSNKTGNPIGKTKSLRNSKHLFIKEQSPKV